MSKKVKNKHIIEKLSSLFKSYNELNSLCMACDYDPEKAKGLISKIIKFAYVKDDFVENDYNMKQIVAYVTRDNVNIDEAYTKYLESKHKKGFFSWFKLSKKDKKLLNEGKDNVSLKEELKLDDDIDRKDIENLRLPSEDKFDEICDMYKIILERREKESQKRELNNQRLSLFDNQVFTYSRYENFRLDKESKYVGMGLTGDFDQDYMILYGDERYTGNNYVDSPLKNNIHENVASIRSRNDIKISVIGDILKIENGRHRLVYIINYFNGIDIPLYVTRQIEDDEFNNLLKSLDESNIGSIFKNNKLNDNPNICIEKDGTVYVIHDKDELKSFSKKVKDNEALDVFENFNFSIDGEHIEYSEMLKYKLEIIKLCKKYGLSVINQDFSELVKTFEHTEELSSNRILYEAFEILQTEYSKYNAFDLDFEKYLKDEEKRIVEVILEREDKIRE